jgi:hypothetical protein
VRDEGKFIKPERIIIRNNQLTLIVESLSKESFYQTMVKNKRVFSVVDPMKYDNYPLYQPTVENFNNMKNEEQQNVLNDWNWLGFENNFDINGDDIQGYDLNKKVSSFDVELLVKQL